MTNLDRYYKALEKLATIQRNQYLRLGQHTFNEMHTALPEIVNELRGGAVDPFHDDSLVVHFLASVKGGAINADKEA